MIRYEIDIVAEVEKIEENLKMPPRDLMRSLYVKLLQHPGSVVLMALEAPREPDGPKWKMAWFDARERDVMRKAIVKLNERRHKKKQPLTSDPPNAQGNQSP